MEHRNGLATTGPVPPPLLKPRQALTLIELRAQIEQLDNLPSMPAILLPVLRALDAPVEQVSIQRVTDLVSNDKSLAAQVLHMANSPLFGQWARVDSIRSAIVTLGLTRLRDIVTSCCMLHILPASSSALDPTVFWEHSLATALLARRIALKVGIAEPEKVYLAGLLHDIGLIAQILVIPKQFESALKAASTAGIPLQTAEVEVFGVSHTISGGILAERWKLGPELYEVIRCHHDLERAELYKPLVAIVSIADAICRSRQLGHGYTEARTLALQAEPGWKLLTSAHPKARYLDFGHLSSGLDQYLGEVRKLITVLFRTANLR